VSHHDFLCGVIEGFYGRPWTHEQRLALLPRLRAWGMNTYLYGPKDDIKLRARWRERYAPTEAMRLEALVHACHGAGLRFVYAIAPGLDIRYGDAADVRRLLTKVDQLLDMGVRDVALLFDDIPHALDADAEARFGSIAAAQAHVAEALFDHVRQQRPRGLRLLCPTDYCGRMADADGWSYLRDLAQRLQPDVQVLWTGDEIVSERLDAASLARATDVLGRKPLLWDNLHANDYDLRRAYLGPFDGRAADLVDAATGVLTNPNGQFELNDVAFATLAAYARDPRAYRSDEALDAALAAWRPRFALDGGELLGERELRLLAELLYLPWRCGPQVEARLEDARSLLGDAPGAAGAPLERVRAFADEVERLLARLTELTDRDLLYALYGFVWEARSESRLLAGYLSHRARHGAEAPRFGRPHPIPNTYRLGFAAAVQALLPLDDGGAVVPSAAGGGRS
jgi:hypothetical protein